MSNSSQQDSYSITLSDDVLDLSSLDTVTITGAGASGTSNTVVLDLSGGSNTAFGYNTGSFTTTGISNVAIGSLTASDITFNWASTEEWKDGFPDWDRIQKMCDQYPGLKIAFEKFKTTYKLVKDDYDTPQDKRTKP